MRYIEISNIGEISQDAIELLGYSDKRGNANLVGEKGTGIKFSRLQALRQGLDFVVATHSFKNKMIEKKGEHRVYFQYDFKNGKKKNEKSSYTRMAGSFDWVDDWFILREVVQNARDETYRHGLEQENAMEWTIQNIRIVNEIDFAKRGNTNVYITLTPRIEEVFKNIADYLCKDDAFVLPRTEGKMRIYKQGIFVREYDEQSFCNYNLNGIDLSESRDIKYDFQVFDEILKKWSEQPTKELRDFIRYSRNNFDNIEWRRPIGDVYVNANNIIEAAKEEFGDVIIHHSDSVSEYQKERAQQARKPIIALPRKLYNILELEHDFITFDRLAKEDKKSGMRKVELSTEEQAILDSAIQKVSKIIPINNPIHVFESLRSEENKMRGFFNPESKCIGLNKEIMASDKEVFTVLLEEAIHAATGAEDFSREFQNECLKLIYNISQKELT